MILNEVTDPVRLVEKIHALKKRIEITENVLDAYQCTLDMYLKEMEALTNDR